MKESTKTWLKAAGIRALRTLAQSAIAAIGTAVAMNEVNWIAVASVAGLSAVISLLMSLKGLPEIKEEGIEG